MFEKVKKIEGLAIFENQNVTDVRIEEQYLEIMTSGNTFRAKLALGADGANSIFNRKLTENRLQKNHHCAGLRQYYKNVKGFKADGSIELHFYKEALPGYFWIFPLPNNEANVGLGMLSSEVSKKRVHLKNLLDELIATHPNLKERFKDAEALESIQGFGLPIGSRKKQLSGDRFLLLGDAANLIDPFTGEGIGNAIRSGRIAANHVLNAFEHQEFNSQFNKRYDKEIYRRMWPELRVGRTLQNLLRFPKLFNFVVKKANKNDSLKLLLTSMLDDVNLKKELTRPSFYFRLLFK